MKVFRVPIALVLVVLFIQGCDKENPQGPGLPNPPDLPPDPPPDEPPELLGLWTVAGSEGDIAGPRDVAIDPQGWVYTCGSNWEVLKLTLDGHRVARWPLETPLDVAVGPDGTGAAL